MCGPSWFPVAELSQRLKQKSVKNPITKINEYQREYQQICKQTPRFTIGDCAGGHRADNREKNRDVLVVPREFDATGGREMIFSPLDSPEQFSPFAYSGQFSPVLDQLSGQQFHGLYKRRLCGRKSVKYINLSIFNPSIFIIYLALSKKKSAFLNRGRTFNENFTKRCDNYIIRCKNNVYY